MALVDSGPELQPHLGEQYTALLLVAVPRRVRVPVNTLGIQAVLVVVLIYQRQVAAAGALSLLLPIHGDMAALAVQVVGGVGMRLIHPAVLEYRGKERLAVELLAGLLPKN